MLYFKNEFRYGSATIGANDLGISYAGAGAGMTMDAIRGDGSDRCTDRDGVLPVDTRTRRRTTLRTLWVEMTCRGSSNIRTFADGQELKSWAACYAKRPNISDRSNTSEA